MQGHRNGMLPSPYSVGLALLDLVGQMASTLPTTFVTRPNNDRVSKIVLGPGHTAVFVYSRQYSKFHILANASHVRAFK